jgi:Uma2 family endonuclease
MVTAVEARGEPAPRPFTVVEYYRMADLGILGPEERLELLDGRLIVMPPIGPPHAYDVMRLTALFSASVGDLALVSVQLPIHLSEISEPQPDLMLLVPPMERYQRVHPRPSDVLLLVEIAVTSLAYDQAQKLQAYARAGVYEYWIVDLVHQQVEVHTGPQGEAYHGNQIARRGEHITPRAFSDLAISVDALLPPA